VATGTGVGVGVGVAVIVGVATATWVAGVLLSDEPQELTARDRSRNEAVATTT